MDEERSPDKRPSDAEWLVEDRGDKTIGVMRVRGLGALVMTGDSTLVHGVSIFTDEEILFD